MHANFGHEILCAAHALIHPRGPCGYASGRVVACRGFNYVCIRLQASRPIPGSIATSSANGKSQTSSGLPSGRQPPPVFVLSPLRQRTV